LCASLLNSNSLLASACTPTDAKFLANTRYIKGNTELESVPSAWPATDKNGETIPHSTATCPSAPAPQQESSAGILSMTGVIVALACAVAFFAYYQKKRWAENNENPLQKSLLDEDSLEMGPLLCRLSALKSNFPATMQRESRESGGGAGRPIGAAPTPIPAPHACPHAPCPEIAKILKKTRPITISLKRRFKQSAVSMASCGYSWVMASRGDGAWVPVNEIGKLEDLPREQGSRIVALACTWYGDPSMTTMAVPKGKLFAGVDGPVLPCGITSQTTAKTAPVDLRLLLRATLVDLQKPISHEPSLHMEVSLFTMAVANMHTSFERFLGVITSDY
jgi:hypothetical protein